jgi:transcriptional regulator with XRE-family HTH domain
MEQKTADILKKFGKHIKKLREKQGLSLREMSYACNLDNSKISKIEQGRINITLLTLIELSSGLEVHPSELLSILKY